MFYQIINNSKKRNNQVRVASKQAIFSKVKELGWNLNNCSITELKSELVNNTYKDLDGRMNVRGKQFMQRSL